MGEWRETTLGEVVDIKGGKRLPKGETLISIQTNHPYIRITDLDNNQVKINQLQFISDKTFSKISRYIVNTDDVIVSVVGTIGLIALIDERLNNANLTENCNKLIIKNLDTLNSKYLFYYLISRIGQYEINKNTVGAVQKKLPIYGVDNICITLPPLQEQKAIANILFSFDDKIGLLKEQNETLEQMAQGVFKESLTKFENSNKTTLGELVKIKYGKDHKHLEDGDFPLYGSGGVMRYVEKTLYNKESILIPRKGTLTNLFFIQEPFWSVDTIFYTEIDESLVSPIYLFYKLKRINLANLNVGSAVPSLTTNVLNAMELEVPPRDEQEETVQLLTSFNNKVLYNNSQIKTLEKTRDTLLPKLMSGEVRL